MARALRQLVELPRGICSPFSSSTTPTTDAARCGVIGSMVLMVLLGVDGSRCLKNGRQRLAAGAQLHP